MQGAIRPAGNQDAAVLEDRRGMSLTGRAERARGENERAAGRIAGLDALLDQDRVPHRQALVVALSRTCTETARALVDRQLEIELRLHDRDPVLDRLALLLRARAGLLAALLVQLREQVGEEVTAGRVGLGRLRPVRDR